MPHDWAGNAGRLNDTRSTWNADVSDPRETFAFAAQHREKEPVWVIVNKTWYE